MNQKSYVEFKGTKNGLVVHLNEAIDYDTIKKILFEKLERTKNFFMGAKLASIEGKNLTEAEKREIVGLMKDRYGIVIEESKDIAIDAELEREEGVFTGIYEGMTKFVRATLRSGNKLRYNGNIILLGDVNPGAEIIANGNIIVMGTLRGIAHAGANGNDKAFVASINLLPTQLRIGKYIGRSPDSIGYKPNYPEIAYVKEDRIIIEPFLSSKLKHFDMVEM